MKIIFAFIAVIVFGYSCNKSHDAGTAQHGVLIHYVDSTGKDLFSTNNEGLNGFFIDSVIAYDITKGIKDVFTCYENRPGVLFQNLNVMRTQICPNIDIVNRYSRALIHLKTGIDDTIRVHINENNISPSANADSVWYNGVLKTYDTTGNILVIK